VLAAQDFQSTYWEIAMFSRTNTALIIASFVTALLSGCAVNGADVSFDGSGSGSYSSPDDILKKMEADSLGG
jgi:hypothetical protein